MANLFTITVDSDLKGNMKMLGGLNVAAKKSIIKVLHRATSAVYKLIPEEQRNL